MLHCINVKHKKHTAQPSSPYKVSIKYFNGRIHCNKWTRTKQHSLGHQENMNWPLSDCMCSQTNIVASPTEGNGSQTQQIPPSNSKATGLSKKWEDMRTPEQDNQAKKTLWLWVPKCMMLLLKYPSSQTSWASHGDQQTLQRTLQICFSWLFGTSHCSRITLSRLFWIFLQSFHLQPRLGPAWFFQMAYWVVDVSLSPFVVLSSVLFTCWLQCKSL